MLRLIGLAALVFAEEALADCQGDIRQDHRIGSFDFVTSSWVERAPDGFYRYMTCVFNPDTKNDIQVNWYIPGPNKQWIPAGETLPHPRLSADGKKRPLDGCLEYGNLGERTVAQFMGDTKEEQETGSAFEKACRAESKEAVALKTPVIELQNGGVKNAVHFWFPSDPHRPKETMLQLDGAFILNTKEGGYTATFGYNVARYKDRPDGNPDDVKLQFVFPSWTSSFDAAMKELGVTKLSDKGEVAFSVTSPSNKWEVTSATVAFTNKDGDMLSALRVPVFVEAGKYR